MKSFFSRFALLAALALLPSLAMAQVGQGTQTYWNASRQDAANNVATSATSAATLTLTPAAGQSVYLTGIDIQNCAGASAVVAAGVTSVTSTNLNGLAYTVGSGVTAGLCQPIQAASFGPGGLKAATPGTAVTIVLPTFATNQTVRVNAYWYSAP